MFVSCKYRAVLSKNNTFILSKKNNAPKFTSVALFPHSPVSPHKSTPTHVSARRVIAASAAATFPLICNFHRGNFAHLSRANNKSEFLARASRTRFLVRRVRGAHHAFLPKFNATSRKKVADREERAE